MVNGSRKSSKGGGEITARNSTRPTGLLEATQLLFLQFQRPLRNVFFFCPSSFINCYHCGGNGFVNGPRSPPSVLHSRLIGFAVPHKGREQHISSVQMCKYIIHHHERRWSGNQKALVRRLALCFCCRSLCNSTFRFFFSVIVLFFAFSLHFEGIWMRLIECTITGFRHCDGDVRLPY